MDRLAASYSYNSVAYHRGTREIDPSPSLSLSGSLPRRVFASLTHATASPKAECHVISSVYTPALAHASLNFRPPECFIVSYTSLRGSRRLHLANSSRSEPRSNNQLCATYSSAYNKSI